MKGYIKHMAFLLLAALLLAACQRNTKYPYAIRDFDADVQPLLESLASKGILNNNGLLEMELQGKLSKKELKKLSTCDVPLLRAFALESLLTTGEFLTIKTDITFGHLDDTACVAIDMGEFGILRYLVSDFVIMTFRTNSTVDSVLENRLIHELFTQRPYLRTTYSIQSEKVSRLPNGYQLIRNIVELKYKPVPINEPFEGGEAEEMLLRLAAFQKSTDTTLIRMRL
ncbi:hypothetical protein [Phnomibacter sp. MR]|uniref:hypothetical protein n=1 Tax=Phnomibacter sp. MR TaxID=3042318 RepID=UPI003A8057F7